MKVMKLDNLFSEQLTDTADMRRQKEQSRAEQSRSEEIRKKQRQMHKYIHSNYDFKYMSKRTPLMSSNYQDI